MVFSATDNNSSVISWQSALFVVECSNGRCFGCMHACTLFTILHITTIHT